MVLQTVTKQQREMRLRFHAAFGSVFYPCSNTMVQKCWRAVQEVPEAERFALIDLLLQAAVAKHGARKENVR